VKVAVDTNILAYAEGVNGATRQEPAVDLLSRLPEGTTILPVQALGELFNVLVKKARRTRAEARTAILTWQDAFQLVETSPAIMLAAADLATDHQFSIWDSVIVCAAAEAGCRLLLSEDLQEGFTWGGVTVTNPFATTMHPLLASLLKSDQPAAENDDAPDVTEDPN
jgi:predicted nucleic acid-binding protein